MIYIGMDVSSKSFVVHAINEKKKVVLRDEIPATRSALRATVWAAVQSWLFLKLATS